jgi:hypothetical protein
VTELNPNATTVYDLCRQALKDAGVLGVGQTPLSEDINDAWVRLQWMLQQWERSRWMIFHTVTYIIPCVPTQITPYSVGPGGQINTESPSDFNSDYNPDFGGNQLTVRPNQIESAFFQQNTTGSGTPAQPGVPLGQFIAQQSQIGSVPATGTLSPIVYPLRLYRAMEDYRRISLPSLTTFPLAAYYDPAWPLGQLYIWPWPNSAAYSIGIVAREQLPQGFANLTNTIYLPYEYFEAIVSNVAIRLRPKYGIGTFPGDMLPAIAKKGLDTIRKGSTQIAQIQMPAELVRTGNYNIYSDQTY